jgi:hypothetical protein
MADGHRAAFTLKQDSHANRAPPIHITELGDLAQNISGVMDVISIFDPTSGNQSRLALETLCDACGTLTCHQMLESLVVLLRLFEAHGDRWGAELWDVVKNRGVQFVQHEHHTDMQAAESLRVHRMRAGKRAEQQTAVNKALDTSVRTSSVSRNSWYVTRLQLVAPKRGGVCPLIHFITHELKDRLDVLCVSCQYSGNAILAAEIKSMGAMLRIIDPESHRFMFSVVGEMQQSYVGVARTAELLQQVVRECETKKLAWCVGWARANRIIWDLAPGRNGGASDDRYAKYVKLMHMFYPAKSCSVVLNATSLGMHRAYHNDIICPDIYTPDLCYGLADFEKFLQCFGQSFARDRDMMQCDDPYSSPVDRVPDLSTRFYIR